MENNKLNSIKLWVVIELYPSIQNLQTIHSSSYGSDYNTFNNDSNYGNYELDLSRHNYRKNNLSPSSTFSELESNEPLNNLWFDRCRINKLDNIRLVGIYSSLKQAQTVSFQNPNTKILEPFDFNQND